jgi:hypothetical protein
VIDHGGNEVSVVLPSQETVSGALRVPPPDAVLAVAPGTLLVMPANTGVQPIVVCGFRLTPE